MAFGGSFGKFFGISTPEAAQIGAAYATGGIPAAIATTVSSLGEGTDVPNRGPIMTTVPSNLSRGGPEPSPAVPAGVDSPASLSQVSQTSMVPQQAFLGGFGLAAPALAAGRTLGRSLFGSPGAAFTTGSVATAAVDFFVDQFGQQRKLVITRKLQRDIKKIFMMTGGDARTTSDIYRSATGRFIPEDMIFKILFKTFKNQGPYVTKAAVRKTRQTIRKMETLCDLKVRLAPPKRRAPARRRTMSTSITQVK